MFRAVTEKLVIVLDYFLTGGLWSQESNMAERNPSQGGGPYTTRDRSHVNYNYNYPRLNTNDR